ncbi:hypothetical protein [Mycolicibacterium llatzerense]|uniref:hypothetical protein n=1 Tax=Mycolicibacterium llatzerense TaxID=280871 RepID=UPI000A64EAFE|nr:hypothetical protein [Mycolicibacterium llatzerense]
MGSAAAAARWLAGPTRAGPAWARRRVGPGPQQPWPAPVPSNKGGAAKWVIGAVALVAVIAVTAVVTASWTKNSSNGGGAAGGTTTSAAPSDVASANDKGPVGIITEDPSCAPWNSIANTLSDIENKGWLTRDSSIPAPSWTPDIRAQYEAVGKAMKAAADMVVPLAKMTPHRVMRELYEQSIAYLRAYANSIPTYTPADDGLARAASTAGNVITNICAATSFGSAVARASLIAPPAAPTSTAPIGDVVNARRMFDAPDAVCPDLVPTLDQLLTNPSFKEWITSDPAVAVGNWPPERQALTDLVTPLMTSTADALEKLAQKSANPIVQDFILLGVQYRRTFVKATSTYQPSDQYIYLAGQYAPGILSGACTSAGR